MRILVATENIGKFLEISQYLKWEGINFTSQKDLGFKSQPEIGQSFVENAIAKARFACRSTGLISLAEDSGLVVPALNGILGSIRQGLQEQMPLIARIWRNYYSGWKTSKILSAELFLFAL